MTREEWIKFIVISVIYVILCIMKELIKERREK
nr:MAG TPA: chitin synthase regulator [Caudoviricetes sp.]